MKTSHIARLYVFVIFESTAGGRMSHHYIFEMFMVPRGVIVPNFVSYFIPRAVPQ